MLASYDKANYPAMMNHTRVQDIFTKVTTPLLLHATFLLPSSNFAFFPQLLPLISHVPHAVQQNRMPCLLPSFASSSPPPPPSSFNLPKPSWNDAFLSSCSFMAFFFFFLHGFLSDLVGVVAGFSHYQPFS